MACSKLEARGHLLHKTGTPPKHISRECICVLSSKGKTELQQVFVNNHFTGEYIPTVYDNFKKTVPVEGRPIDIDLCDTAGQEDYDRFRPTAYTNVVRFLQLF